MIKKLFLGAAIIGSLMTSCSNEIDLVDTKREIPVIYGFLSRQDTAHYIRIERAFGDDKISAITLAKTIDSLYYKDVTVELVRERDNKVYKLNVVDGNKEGYKRESGIFVDSPNYLYKIKAKDINLEENQTYKLVVKRNDGALITEAKTVILPDMQLKENRTLLGSPPRLNVSGRLSIFWTASDVRVSKMYDISMLMQIQEVPKDGSPVRKLNLEWVIAKGFVPNPNTGEVKYDALLVEYRQSNDAFYEFLAKNLEGSKPATRKLEFVKIKVSSGDNELFQYLDVANINLGITGTEVIPTYSNIKNGYGLFSSRNYFISKELYLNENSLDSLYNSRLTKRFGFVD